jgi:hypothetical protein
MINSTFGGLAALMRLINEIIAKYFKNTRMMSVSVQPQIQTKNILEKNESGVREKSINAFQLIVNYMLVTHDTREKKTFSHSLLFSPK